jgi:hypothetical protein
VTMTNGTERLWQFFNWPNIIQEARMRHAEARHSTAAAITPEMRTLEYWTAHVAHANLAACVSDGEDQKR